MRIDISRVKICKLASGLASQFRRGDLIRRVFEKTSCDYKVIVSIVKWDLFSTFIAVVENAK